LIDDYAYATGRARALEAKIRAVETMAPAQIAREYGIDEGDLDGSLDALMEKSLSEFADSAPEAVIPFRRIADMTNAKAFLRSQKLGVGMEFSRLGTFSALGRREEVLAGLKDAGYPEVAQRFEELLKMKLSSADVWLEDYFMGRIGNAFFREYLEFRRKCMESEEGPEKAYKRLGGMIREKSMLKNMHIDVITAFLLMKSRELELVRSRVLGAKEVIA
jgi:hypothetical protein